jgi:LysM repeat protein
MRARASLAVTCLAAIFVAAGCNVRDKDPTPTPSNVFVVVTPTPGMLPASTATTDRPTTYIVQPGDNLSDIADELGVTLRDLQEANGIEDPDSIFAGQELIVPTPEP